MTSLDGQVMAFADALENAGNTEAAEELRSYAASIREAVRGADFYPRLADALQAVADSAEAAADVVRDHTVPPLGQSSLS
ncbi:hypothetical protein [Streptomyces sp. NPDC059009]|uniref:hypothetical protein n=1 Tax=Streptomyces sp. NPDC059009 TaxID=3346694 RepID=UPI0036757A24